jgi:DNA mismatch endonuclease (patch repair protein)
MTKTQRSLLMAKVKSKDTGIELKLIDGLRKRKIRDFLRNSKLIGKPDIIFEKQKLVIFCDGDFWHGYKFDINKSKLSNFWLNKISSNRKRDLKVTRKLRKQGWQVIRFWGHEIIKNTDKCIDRIEAAKG